LVAPEGGAVHVTVKFPSKDVAGTVMLGGGEGATIWHPFALAVQAEFPTAFVAHTRYHHVPDVFPVTLKDVFAPL
jgi:hypothetical protein